MNTQQIIDFVRQEISKGASKERVAQVLRINGVSQTEIDQAISAIGPSAAAPPPQELARPIMPPPLTPPPTPPFRPASLADREPMATAPMSTSQTMPRKSHGGLIAFVIILLLLLGAGGASAYVYMYQPDLVKNIPVIGKLLNPIPTPEEAVTKMKENYGKIKSFGYNFNIDTSGVIPTSATEDSAGSLSIQTKGSIDMVDPQNLKFDSTMTIQGKMDVEGMQVSADFGAAAMGIDKTMYVKLNRIPSFIPVSELPSFIGQWIKFDPETVAAESPAFANFGNPTELGLTSQEMKDLNDQILAAKPVQLGSFIGEEELNGKKTYNYPIIFSKEGLKKTVDIMFGLASKVETRVNGPMTATSTQDLNEGLAIIKSYIDDNNLPEGKIWIGQDDFLPYKIAFEDINIPIPDELKAELPNPNVKLNLSLVLEYSDYNQPVDIKAPTSFKTFNEIMGTMVPKAATSTKATTTTKTTGAKARKTSN